MDILLWKSWSWKPCGFGVIEPAKTVERLIFGVGLWPLPLHTDKPQTSQKVQLILRLLKRSQLSTTYNINSVLLTYQESLSPGGETSTFAIYSPPHRNLDNGTPASAFQEPPGSHLAVRFKGEQACHICGQLSVCNGTLSLTILTLKSYKIAKVKVSG